jgi:hypothetical protein
MATTNPNENLIYNKDNGNAVHNHPTENKKINTRVILKHDSL